MKDQQTREAFIQLRADGQSFEKIAATLRVSKQTLINWSRIHKLDLDNAKSIARDAQLRRYELHEQGRIELLGEMLKKMREEVMARNLANIGTERLIELIIKVTKLVSSVQTSVVFRSPEPEKDLFDRLLNEDSWEA